MLLIATELGITKEPQIAKIYYNLVRIDKISILMVFERPFRSDLK